MLSRTHWMSLDEASQILNIKKGAIVEDSELQKMLKVRWVVGCLFFPARSVTSATPADAPLLPSLHASPHLSSPLSPPTTTHLSTNPTSSPPTPAPPPTLSNALFPPTEL